MAKHLTRLLTMAAIGSIPMIAGATAAGAQVPGFPRCTIQGRGVVAGTPGNDVICGSTGNDVLIGRGGNDILLSGPGNDRLFGGPGRDRLYGGPGNDWLFDPIEGGVVNGGPGHDECIGFGDVTWQECESSRNVGLRLSGLRIRITGGNVTITGQPPR